MKINLYSVYDVKLKAYGRPFCSPNDETAERSFQHVVNDSVNAVHLSPSDYTLFAIGSFTDHDGLIETETPRALGNGIEFVVKPEPIQIPEYDGDN